MDRFRIVVLTMFDPGSLLETGDAFVVRQSEQDDSVDVDADFGKNIF